MGEVADRVPRAFADLPDRRECRRLLEALTGVPATEGNRITVLRNGVEIFPAMLEAIEAAEASIDLLTYIWWTGDIAERFTRALAARARAGVRVRVLLDGFGTRPMEARMVDELRDAGAVVATVRPFLGGKPWRWNLRTHRRVLVCDEEVAFTGGVGIAGKWEGDAEGPECWRDTHFRVEGPAVDGVRAAFLVDWLEFDQPVVTGADRFPQRSAAGSSAVQVIRAASQPGWNDAALAVASMITLAQQRIRVTSAYFRSPQHFVELLCAAVGRGVDVDVLVPGPHTEPAFFRWAAEHHYEELLEGGVRLWCYQPTMLHAKVLAVDESVALVGTANFDARSFAMNEQLALVIHDPAVVSTLDDHFDQDLAASRQLELAEWRDRDWRRRAQQLAAHVATFGIRGGGASSRDHLLPASLLPSRRSEPDR